jgi:hypothetical protein
MKRYCIKVSNGRQHMHSHHCSTNDAVHRNVLRLYDMLSKIVLQVTMTTSRRLSYRACVLCRSIVACMCLPTLDTSDRADRFVAHRAGSRLARNRRMRVNLLPDEHYNDLPAARLGLQDWPIVLAGCSSIHEAHGLVHDGSKAFSFTVFAASNRWEL